MIIFKMKYIQLFEKYGVSQDVINFTEYIYNLIFTKYKSEINKFYRDINSLSAKSGFQFDIPKEDIPECFSKVDGINLAKLTIRINSKNYNNMTCNIDNSKLFAVLSYSPQILREDDKIITKFELSTLEHELLHLYQFLRNVDINGASFNIRDINLHKKYYTVDNSIFRDDINFKDFFS